MFGDLFGNVQQQQAALQEKLAAIIVSAETGNGAVLVEASADLRIRDIRIDPAKTDASDHEQLEDLLLEAVNRALDQAREKAGEETSRLLKDMLPGGMGGLFKP